VFGSVDDASPVVGLTMSRDIPGHAVVVTTPRRGRCYVTSVRRSHCTMVFTATALMALDHVAKRVTGMVSTNPPSINPRSLFLLSLPQHR
jgi:hypothetical protein